MFHGNKTRKPRKSKHEQKHLGTIFISSRDLHTILSYILFIMQPKDKIFNLSSGKLKSHFCY